MLRKEMSYLIADYQGMITSPRDLDGWQDFSLYFKNPQTGEHYDSGVDYALNENKSNNLDLLWHSFVTLESHSWDKDAGIYYFNVVKNRFCSSVAAIEYLQEFGFNFQCTHEHVIYITSANADQFIFLVNLTSRH